MPPLAISGIVGILRSNLPLVALSCHESNDTVRSIG